MTKCKSCGIEHRLVLEDMTTHETIPIDWCRECLFTQGYTYKQPEEIVIDGSLGFDKLLKEAEDRIIRDMSS